MDGPPLLRPVSFLQRLGMSVCPGPTVRFTVDDDCNVSEVDWVVSQLTIKRVTMEKGLDCMVVG